MTLTEFVYAISNKYLVDDPTWPGPKIKLILGKTSFLVAVFEEKTDYEFGWVFISDRDNDELHFHSLKHKLGDREAVISISSSTDEKMRSCFRAVFGEKKV
jgi:hypothetical protein